VGGASIAIAGPGTLVNLAGARRDNECASSWLTASKELSDAPMGPAAEVLVGLTPNESERAA
jgi:hypothetical protein